MKTCGGVSDVILPDKSWKPVKQFFDQKLQPTWDEAGAMENRIGLEIKTKLTILELLGLFLFNLGAFVIGVCSETGRILGLQDYLKDVDWLLVAIPSIPLSILPCILYFFMRSVPQKWLLFFVAPIAQYFFGMGFVRMLIF